MTFGGAPNPSQWSDVWEVVADLANDLIRRGDWDPPEWQAPQQHLLSTDKAVNDDVGHVDASAPFAQAFETSVREPIQDGIARYDCYLDDMFWSFP